MELQSILLSILSWYGVKWPEDAIEESLERFIAEVGILSLISKSNTSTCSDDLSIPMSFTGDTVGKEELMLALIVVEGLKGEEKKEFICYISNRCYYARWW